MEEEKDIIAKNLINFRLQAKLTQGELATKLNYSDKSISKWERGLATPDIFVLKRLAELYGVTVDAFLTLTEKTSKIVFDKKINTSRQLLITLMSFGLVWLVATLVFVILLWTKVDRAWLAFIIATPISNIVLIVFSRLWSKLWVVAIFVSTLIWLLAMAIYVTFIHTSAYLLFIICIPMQILVIMWFALRYILLKKGTKKKGQLI